MFSAVRQLPTRVSHTPWMLDVGLAVGAACLVATELFRLDARPIALLALPLQSVPLLWRRARPWPSLLVITVGVAAHVSLVTDLSATPLCAALAVYAVGRYAERWINALSVAVATLGVAAPDLITVSSGGPATGRWPLAADVVVLASGFGLLWLLGRAQHRQVTDSDRLRTLATQLRSEQEANAHRAVLLERTRIARDLHDIVAHHVSAIAVQAHSTADGVASGEAAHTDVVRIGATADLALAEMRRLVGLLTVDGSGAPLTPEPSLSHLTPLVEASEAAGCAVDVVIAPPALEVPMRLQLSAYRIVQEALANAFTHAGRVRVRVELAVADAALTVLIDNAAPKPKSPARPGTGLGLVNMRERTALHGGTLDAGVTAEGGWRVYAVLPLPEPGPEAP